MNMFKQSVKPSSRRLWLAAFVLPVLALTTQIQAADDLRVGLVAYWDFEGSDADRYKDKSPNKKFDGTPEGTVPIASVNGKPGFGKAIKLDGEDQEVEITGGEPDDLAFAGESMSIAGWFKVDAFDTSWQALIVKGEGGNWRVHRRGGEQGMAYTGGPSGDTPTGKAVNDGQWHHFVAITDKDAVNFGTALYIDGVLDTQRAEPQVLAANGLRVKIGENSAAAGREWEGEIDDLAIWDRVLTPSEIGALYANGTGEPLSVFGTLPPGTVTITRQPAGASIIEGLTAEFSVATSFTGKYPPSYQWRKNGADIAGATSASYKTPAVVAADNGAKYTVKASVPGAEVISAEAILTVLTDFTSPTLVSVEGSPSQDRLTLHFSEPMDAATATVLANYAIDGGLTLSAPVLQNQQNVVLMTTKQTPGTRYNVTVNNVKDVFGNAITANTKASFFPATIATGLIAYWNFDGNLQDSIKDFHGTARGTEPVPFVDGKAGFGKAIQLNGEDQFVEITGGNENELEFPSGSVSIAGWFTADAFDTSWQALISKGEGTAYRVARRGGGGSIAYAGGVGEGIDDVPLVEDFLWHHFVAISDATAAAFGTALYVDGIQYGVNANAPVLTSNNLRLMIGENPGARNREWEGKIDDIAIWNRVLTEAELSALYADGPGKPLSAVLPVVPVGPPSISIQRNVAGAPVITYTGTLQSSAIAAGPYAAVPAATSPFTVNPTDPARFYRSQR